LAARRKSNIEVSVKIGNDNKPELWEYSLVFSQDKNRIPKIKGEVVKKSGEVILERPKDEEQDDAELLRQTHLEQTQSNRNFKEVFDFFRRIYYLHIVPQIIRHPDRIIIARNDPYGSDFLSQIANLTEGRRKQRLKKIENALRKVVPQLSDLTFEIDAVGKPHIKAKYHNWRPNAGWQTESTFSDGTLRLTGILWALFGAKGPVLLEEPELSLHPGAVKYLPQMFAMAQKRTVNQMVISSHSYDMFTDEGIGLDETILLIPGSEKTEVKAASDDKDLRTLLEEGLVLADVILPYTAPSDGSQLVFAFE